MIYSGIIGSQNTPMTCRGYTSLGPMLAVSEVHGIWMTTTLAIFNQKNRGVGRRKRWSTNPGTWEFSIEKLKFRFSNTDSWEFQFSLALQNTTSKAI